jgi:hypothetical protein
MYDANPIVGNMTFQELSKIIGGGCAAAVLLLSSMLILLHATHTSNKREQVKMIRIITIIPVFAIISFANIVLQLPGSIYLAPWKEVYEAVALSTFFLLLLTFISPDATKHEEFMSTIPGGLKQYKRSWIAVFQYPIVAVLIAAVTNITEAADVYCIRSNRPRFAHIWMTIIRGASVTVAVISILRFTKQLRTPLKHHHVWLKLFAFKGIVFVSTVQTFVFSIVAGQVEPTNTLSYNDIANTLPELLVCCEMVLFSVFFFFSYSHRPYILHKPGLEDGHAMAPRKYQGGFLGIKSLLSALNPMEILVGLTTAFRMLTGKMADRRQQKQYAMEDSQYRPHEGRRGAYEPVGASPRPVYHGPSHP